MSISMVDVAYQILSDSKKAMKFAELWRTVCKKMNFEEANEVSKMSQFFTNLSLDNRFALIDNTWDIRARHKFEEVVIDASPIDIEEDEEEMILIEEEKSYDDIIDEEEE